MSTPAPFQLSSTPAAIVFEKRSRWGPELERQFVNENVRVVACRSLPDVSDRCAGLSQGVVVLDLAAETAGCLQFLRRLVANSCNLPVFVVASNPLAGLEWSVRDLGATAFFSRKIPGHEMAALCRRQWSISL